MLASRVVDGTRYFVLDDDMMISMRYARNLAEGNGLVWNPGERVEGYTNFLWTVVMAGVHLIPHTDATVALYVKAVNLALQGATLFLAARFVRLFAPRSFVVTPLLLALSITCGDLLHWSTWGFEVGLMGFLNLWFFYRVVQRRYDVVTFAILALLPLVRGDGIYVFAGNAAVAFVLAKGSRQVLVSLALAAIPAVLHFVFRRAYYGDWLPNTYYLKVYGLENTLERGTTYARNFLLAFAVVLAVGAMTAVALMRTDRRGVVFFGAVVPTLGWVSIVGGDMFGGFRFFAHVLPIVFVFAVIGVETLTRGVSGQVAVGAMLFFVYVPLLKPLNRLVVLDTNGDPYEQIQTAMVIKKNARPDSSVAVFAAGIVPYFTRLRAIDLLGKSDTHIARLKPFPGSGIGHGKIDPVYSVAKAPDLVVSLRHRDWIAQLTNDLRTPDPILSFLASRAFQGRYGFHCIDEAFTVSRTAIYTREGSKEDADRVWKGVVVGP